MTQLVQGLTPLQARRPASHQQNTHLFHRTVSQLGNHRCCTRQSGSSCGHRISRIRLSLLATDLTVLPVNLHHLDVGFDEKTSQTHSIRTGSFDTNPRHPAQTSEPRQQVLVSVVVSSEAFNSEEAAIGINCSRHMKVGVSVHTTDHFYDSHRRPFL
jgi:hypothetical protein